MSRGDYCARIDRIKDYIAAGDTVVLSPQAVSSRDKFLYHKTTHREVYEALYARARRHGHEDVILANERGEITEARATTFFWKLPGPWSRHRWIAACCRGSFAGTFLRRIRALGNGL
jgi:para-aminobenzoate synthetase/4-amino-4-deoxychorismate lyase